MMAPLDVVLRGSTIKRYTEFIWYRALAEIRADVSRGFLGFAWWIVKPLLYTGACGCASGWWGAIAQRNFCWHG